MICKNCKNEYDDGLGSCPRCGFSAQENDSLIAPADRKKLRAVRLIVAAALVGAIAAVVVIVRGTGLHGTDAEIFVRLQQQFLLEPILAGVNRMGEPAIENPRAFSDDITLIFNDGEDSLQATIKMDAKPDESMVMNLHFSYLGLDLELFTLTGTEEEIGFYAPLLDSHYYTIQRTALLARLSEAGIFSGDVEEEQELELKKILQVAEIISKYGNILLSVVTDDNVTSEKQTLEINGEEVNCRIYTFCPTAADLEAMFTTLLTQLKADEELIGLLYDSYVSSGSMTELYGVEYDNLGIGGYMSREEFTRGYKDLMDEALASAPETAGRIADAGFSWSVAAKGKRIHRQQLALHSGDLVVYENMGDARKSRYDSLTLADGEERIEFRNSFTRQNDRLTGQFLMTPMTDRDLTVDYEWNLKETSSLGIPLGSGTLSYDGEELRLSVERNEEGGIDHALYLSSQGEQPVFLVRTSEQPSTARAPKASPVDLSDYSLEELQELLAERIAGLLRGGLGF